MSQQLISDAEGGFAVRAALNGNFSELYAAARFPIKIANVGGSFTVPIPANSFVTNTYVTPLIGAPNLSIFYLDIDFNPVYFVQDFDFTTTTPITIQQYFDVDTDLYYEFNNTDTCNIRIDLITDFN